MAVGIGGLDVKHTVYNRNCRDHHCDDCKLKSAVRMVPSPIAPRILCILNVLTRTELSISRARDIFHAE